MLSDSSRRDFLRNSFATFSSAWVAANWPAILDAATHAHQQASSGFPSTFEFFAPAEAAEIDAIASRIIPTDDTPGAREAGAVYFIDRALLTFASSSRSLIRPGLAELQQQTTNLFPSVHKFSEATPAQQDQILRLFDSGLVVPPSPRAAAPPEQGGHPLASGAGRNFFTVVRNLTVTAFLADPDSRGNPNGVGWKLIGRDRDHTFQPPFGYYDRDYPGWQPSPSAPAAKDGK